MTAVGSWFTPEMFQRIGQRIAQQRPELAERFQSWRAPQPAPSGMGGIAPPREPRPDFLLGPNYQPPPTTPERQALIDQYGGIENVPFPELIRTMWQPGPPQPPRSGLGGWTDRVARERFAPRQPQTIGGLGGRTPPMGRVIDGMGGTGGGFTGPIGSSGGPVISTGGGTIGGLGGRIGRMPQMGRMVRMQAPNGEVEEVSEDEASGFEREGARRL